MADATIRMFVEIKARALGTSIGTGLTIEQCPACARPAVHMKDGTDKKGPYSEWAHECVVSSGPASKPKCDYQNVCRAEGHRLKPAQVKKKAT